MDNVIHKLETVELLEDVVEDMLEGLVQYMGTDLGRAVLVSYRARVCLVTNPVLL